MGIHDLWLFLIAGALLNITPGPDMALVIARSTQHGARAGIAAALGIGTGTFVHIAAAAIGLSAIILASAWAFTAVKWIGAAYLMYIGLLLLRSTFAPSAPPAGGASPLDATTLSQIFWQGALTNALNPKVAVFFLAFLPQFVEPHAPSKAMAFAILGLLFNTVGTARNVVVAVMAGTLAGSTRFLRAKRWLERAIGALFVGIGIKIAMAEAT